MTDYSDCIFIDRAHPANMGGTQRVYRFPNGFGASVTCSPFSYGGAEGKFELAVVKFDSEDNFLIVYDTPITDDVIGWLTKDDVQTYLAQIAAL